MRACVGVIFSALLAFCCMNTFDCVDESSDVIDVLVHDVYCFFF